MNLGRRAQLTVQPGTREGRRRVRYDIGIEPEVPRHAGRCGNAMICGEADNHQCVDALRPQIALEVCADEPAVHAFDVNRFAIQWNGFRHWVESGRTLPELTERRTGSVVYVVNGPVRASPSADQGGDVCFGVRVVSRSPVEVEESLLDIDHHQGGGGRKVDGCSAPLPRRGLVPSIQKLEVRGPAVKLLKRGLRGRGDV